MSISVRKCEIVQQIQYLPGYPDWKSKLEENLESEPNIKKWAYALHGKDHHDDGTLKAPHVHIVLELDESVKVSTVGGYVGVPAQYVGRIKQQYKAGRRWYADIGGALSYLTHRNAKDRYQYDDSEVVAKPGYDWKAERQKSEARQAEQKTMRAILEGIENGSIHRYDLFDNISQQLYIANKGDIEKAFEHREGRIKNSLNDRDVTVIYISGTPGSGKTALAKKYCEDNGLSYCLSASSRDPVQDYDGQDALILDDLRPETFVLPDLLKLLDNHTSSSVNARYHDRWLEAKVIIITTVLPIEDFYRRIGSRDEPIQQLYRRCRTMVRLTLDKMDLFAYRESTGEYMLIGGGENPIAKKYALDQRDASEEELRQICSEFGVRYNPEGLPSDYITEDIPF